MINLLLFISFICQTAAAALPGGMQSPIELLGCFNEHEKHIDVVRVIDSTLYRCKYGWRYGVGSNENETHMPGGIALELSGYNATQLRVFYDRLRLKKVATDPEKSGHTIKLLQVFTTTAHEQQATWFQVEFNYTSCVGETGATLKLVVAPLGSASWPPLIAQLAQDHDTCHASKLREAVNWLGFGGNEFSKASRVRVAMLALFIELLVASVYLVQTS